MHGQDNAGLGALVYPYLRENWGTLFELCSACGKRLIFDEDVLEAYYARYEQVQVR